MLVSPALTRMPAAQIPVYSGATIVAEEPKGPQSPIPEAPGRRIRRESGSVEQQLSTPSWTLPAAPPANSGRASTDTTLGERLLTSMEGGYSTVEVPANSSLAPALDIYAKVLAHPQLQAWLASKGLEMSTLTLHRDSISGYVYRDGVRTAVTFSTTDSSGWGQASVRLRSIRDVLDPADKGLPYLQAGESWLPHSLVLQAFGLQLPVFTEDRDELMASLRTSGLVMPAQQYQQLSVSLERVRQSVGDLDERAFLADQLESAVKDLPDDTPCDWSTQPAQLSVNTPLAAGDQLAQAQLKRFSKSPAVQALIKDLMWPGQLFRVSEGRFEYKAPGGGWIDLTASINGVRELDTELPELVSLSQAQGNALYSAPYCDVRQYLDNKGLGSPRTAGETRNVVRWLRAGTLPPAPPLRDYAALMARDWSPGQLTSDDKTILKARADQRFGGEAPRGFYDLDELTEQQLQADPTEALEKLLNSPDALAFGEELAWDLKWPGSPVPKAVSQQLVLAALALHADAEAPAQPGVIAGYNVYQLANMGRSFSDVRRDVEKHLQERGLDPKLAVLVAHIGLAQAAPEFLVKDVPPSIRVGTPAWVELRLGAAMADRVAPGTSRGMTEEQVSELTTLAPTSEGQASLMQLHSMKLLLDWAVLNGVIPAPIDGEHPPEALKTASEAFFKQREEVNTALSAVTAMPDRKIMAIQELLKVFPDYTASQLQAMTVMIADGDVRRNMPISEPRTRSLVETYMTGDLTPGKWVLTRDMPQAAVRPWTSPFQRIPEVIAPQEKRDALDARIRKLPTLDTMLQTAVNEYRQSLQTVYTTRLKLMFSELPLEDRQMLERGTVQLYGIRGETGLPPATETTADRDAARGRQGTLLRAELDGKVNYYEVFANGTIVKRTDLPIQLKLGDASGGRLNPMGLQGGYVTAFSGGFSLAVDYEAYAKGTEAKPGSTSKVIVGKLGGPIVGRSLEAGEALQTYVPGTYASSKIHSIASRIAELNFYEADDAMLARAKGSLPLEKQREVLGAEKAILLGLVPFVGAYQEFAAGNIGKGLFNLGLDAVGLALGAGGRARALIRAGKSVTPNPVGGALRKLGSAVRPLTPKVAWAKPVESFGDRAFNFLKATALFTSAAMNPADGYGQLVNAALKGMIKLPLLASGATRLGKAAPHLITVEEKLRSFWLAGAWDSNAPVQSTGSPGVSQGVPVSAQWHRGNWYAINPETNQLFGTPLRDFRLGA